MVEGYSAGNLPSSKQPGSGQGAGEGRQDVIPKGTPLMTYFLSRIPPSSPFRLLLHQVD